MVCEPIVEVSIICSLSWLFFKNPLYKFSRSLPLKFNIFNFLWITCDSTRKYLWVESKDNEIWSLALSFTARIIDISMSIFMLPWIGANSLSTLFKKHLWLYRENIMILLFVARKTGVESEINIRFLLPSQLQLLHWIGAHSFDSLFYCCPRKCQSLSLLLWDTVK